MGHHNPGRSVGALNIRRRRDISRACHAVARTGAGASSRSAGSPASSGHLALALVEIERRIQLTLLCQQVLSCASCSNDLPTAPEKSPSIFSQRARRSFSYARHALVERTQRMLDALHRTNGVVRIKNGRRKWHWPAMKKLCRSCSCGERGFMRRTIPLPLLLAARD